MAAKKKAGRPKGLKSTQIKLITDLAAIGHTAEEIAVIIGIHPTTITKNYRDVYLKGLAGMKTSLRRKQFEVATEGKGNVTMLIWLGKQYLGQSDEGMTSDVLDDVVEIRINQLQIKKKVIYVK